MTIFKKCEAVPRFQRLSVCLKNTSFQTKDDDYCKSKHISSSKHFYVQQAILLK